MAGDQSGKFPGKTRTAKFLLSVVIPIYNEERTLRVLIDRVRAVPIRKELVLVDRLPRTASGKVRPSIFIKKSTGPPLSLQPKQWKKPRSAFTWKLGDFSL